MNQKLGFGKFKGKYISDCPSWYVKWLTLNAHDFSVKKAAQDEWTYRTTWGKHWAMPTEKRFS